MNPCYEITFIWVTMKNDSVNKKLVFSWLLSLNQCIQSLMRDRPLQPRLYIALTKSRGMNYASDFSNQPSGEAVINNDKAQLEAQVAMLTEWKHQAREQLEHYRIACSIYNFCDARQLHELLSR